MQFFQMIILLVLLYLPLFAYARPIGTQPNFLILFPDQWRFDWGSNLTYQLYSPSSPSLALSMPTFNKLYNSGIRFTKAHVPSPLCAPSRSCLASGKEYDYAGVPDNFSNDYPLNQTTVYTLLQDIGYYTMTTGKDDLTKATGMGINGTYHAQQLGWVNYSRCAGKDDVLRMGIPADPYGYYTSQNSEILPNGTKVTWWKILSELDKSCCENAGGSGTEYVCDEPTLMPQLGYEDNYIASHTMKLLETVPTNQPWFLQINFAGPHPPFIVTSSMMNTTQELSFPIAINNTLMSNNDQQIVRRDYAAELENLDSLFNKILTTLYNREDANNTIIIMASDHGEELGDHNNWGKTMPWSGSASVPFVITPSSMELATVLGIPINRTINHVPVTTMDITGTVLDFAGTVPCENMTTVSLRSLLTNATSSVESPQYRTYTQSGLGNWRMVLQSTAYMNSSITNTSTIYKFICCKGPCPGQPGSNHAFIDDEWKTIFKNSNATTSTSSLSTTSIVSLTEQNTTNVKLLYDINNDPYDTTNLADTYPLVVAVMRELLPPGWCKG